MTSEERRDIEIHSRPDSGAAGFQVRRVKNGPDRNYS